MANLRSWRAQGLLIDTETTLIKVNADKGSLQMHLPLMSHEEIKKLNAPFVDAHQHCAVAHPGVFLAAKQL